MSADCIWISGATWVRSRVETEVGPEGGRRRKRTCWNPSFQANSDELWRGGAGECVQSLVALLTVGRRAFAGLNEDIQQIFFSAAPVLLRMHGQTDSRPPTSVLPGKLLERVAPVVWNPQRKLSAYLEHKGEKTQKKVEKKSFFSTLNNVYFLRRPSGLLWSSCSFNVACRDILVL